MNRQDATDPAPLGTGAFGEAVELRRSFEPEELVASRFRIVRLLGEGAMGQVYEAEDLELARRVALKCVHEGVGREIFDRFKREVALATRVTHPNVCRVFDVGRHRKTWPSGEVTDVIFLTMELLEGETLRQRLSRGKLTTGEALPMLAQIAAALDAAHGAGVIHRDLKPENVLLVGAGSQPRVLVTDFGIARSTDSEPSLGATGTGLVVGTPAYMAPEQAQGVEPTPQTDVYAFGLLAFEMLTGRLPEERASALTMLMKRISSPPRSPRELLPDLDARWEAAILRCLALDPAQRFASAGEALRALTAELPPLTPKRRSRLLLAGALTAVVAVAAIGIAAVWVRVPGRRGAPRKSVAVLGFKNASAREADAWISTALAEMLSTELAAGRKLRAVAGESIADAKRELKLPDADGYGSESLKRIRRRLGADYVVVGSFLASEAGTSRLRLDFKVQDTEEGETVAARVEEGVASDLSELVSRAGAWLRERLEGGSVDERQAVALKASAPPSYEAARLYASGLERLRRYDPRAACAFLRRAVEHAPDFTLARLKLAEALASQGREREALEQARVAFEQSARLGREDRLAVEALYRQLSHDEERAIALHRTLYQAAPDGLEEGLHLAAAQSRAGKQDDALATLAALRRLPSPLRDDPRIPFRETHAAMVLGDFARMLAGAEEGVRKAEALGARVLQARALRQKGVALSKLGRLPEGVEALEGARRLFAEADQQDGLAAISHSMADARQDQGRLGEALTLIDEAGRRYEAVGVLNTSYIPYTRGSILLDLGRLPEGERHLAAAIEMERALNATRGYYSECELGRALAMRGELPAAAAKLIEVEGVARARHDNGALGRTLHLLGLVRLLQGDLAAARRLLEEALVLQRADGEASLAPNDTALSLARLALEEGHPVDAAPAAQRAADVFARQGAAAKESVALAVLAESLARAGKREDAAAALTQALARPVESMEARARRAVHGCLALSELGERARGEALARDALGIVAPSGLVAAALELRLAMATAARRGDAVQQLELLEREARGKGIELVARRARQLRAAPTAAPAGP